MWLIVDGPDSAEWNGRRLRCAVGRSGLARDKREGDGATPVGRFPFRRVLYRADRVPDPATTLDAAPVRPQDGWCDDPEDARYNRQVALPYQAGSETLWRDDALYDVIVVLGHNDDPVIPGRGSAIFLHVAGPGYAATQGCIALARDDLLEVLAEAAPGDGVEVRPGE